jgi:hypothetical protein
MAALMIAGLAPPTVQSAQAAPPSASWDGLVKVKSKKLKAVYLAPDADFRPYTKVMLDPTEVAFKKNWIRDYNSSTRALRLSDDDAQKIKEAVSTGFGDIFAKAYANAGFQVVDAPGPDVLRVRTAVINLSITAPDTMSAGRSRVYADSAGYATMVIEARDSQTGAILGRAVDARIAGDTMPYLNRTRATNRADFSSMFQTWAKASAAGIATLKSMSPVNAASAGATE